jgi:hypothetical protein
MSASFRDRCFKLLSPSRAVESTRLRLMLRVCRAVKELSGDVMAPGVVSSRLSMVVMLLSTALMPS